MSERVEALVEQIDAYGALSRYAKEAAFDHRIWSSFEDGLEKDASATAVVLECLEAGVDKEALVGKALLPLLRLGKGAVKRTLTADVGKGITEARTWLKPKFLLGMGAIDAGARMVLGKQKPLQAVGGATGITPLASALGEWESAYSKVGSAEEDPGEVAGAVVKTAEVLGIDLSIDDVFAGNEKAAEALEVMEKVALLTSIPLLGRLAQKAGPFIKQRLPTFRKLPGVGHGLQAVERLGERATALGAIQTQRQTGQMAAETARRAGQRMKSPSRGVRSRAAVTLPRSGTEARTARGSARTLAGQYRAGYGLTPKGQPRALPLGSRLRPRVSATGAATTPSVTPGAGGPKVTGTAKGPRAALHPLVLPGLAVGGGMVLGRNR